MCVFMCVYYNVTINNYVKTYTFRMTDKADNE